MYADIDWSGLTASQRKEPTKALYRAFSAVAQHKGLGIDILLDHALESTEQRGTDYASNFRSGRISKARAEVIHLWLAQNHFALGQKEAPHLFPYNPKSAWEIFLDTRRLVGGLVIIPMTKEMGIAQRANEISKSETTLRLGQEFCFELDCAVDGAAVAFQCYAGHWHPMPLGADERRLRVPVNEGRQLLPRDSKGNPIPLVELDDAGHHKFAVVVSNDKALPTDIENLAQRRDDTAIEVHQIAVTFVT